LSVFSFPLKSGDPARLFGIFNPSAVTTVGFSEESNIIIGEPGNFNFQNKKYPEKCVTAAPLVLG
jgi:hypothetical protein